VKPSPRASFLSLAAALGLVVAVAFADVLFASRTLSAAAYVPGVLPSGPFELHGEAPPARHLLDPEGAAWVDEPSPILVSRDLARVRLPLWNPDEGLGAPLAGNPNAAVWSPLSLPVNLRPSALVQDLVWLARIWLLGCFTALLAREIGLGWIASFVAAAALMLSGQTVLWIAHHPLNTDVFVPLALVGGLRTLAGRRSGEPLLTVAVAAGLLGGKPQSALVAGLFGAVWLAAARPAARASDWLRLFRGVAIGAAIAAIALVPFASTYAEASGLVRAGRSTQSASTLPLEGLAALAAPWAAALLGAEAPREGAWLAPGLPYAGVAALALAAYGLATARRRALAWALAATILFYVLRVHAGWFGALESVPLVRSVSFVKYCFPLYLGIALLAGAGAAAAGRTRSACTVLLLVELVSLVPRPHPRRVDAYVPAPYVDRLAALASDRGGRIAGPFDLMPPLVSNALGFADLRAIDVLTPAPTWNFVTRLVSPSRGLTWILTDLDPLLVATAPAADLADVRWVLSREELDPTRLPAAVRALVSARRTTRLFDQMSAYAIETPWLWAGVDALGGDLRFHWTCTTPCRFEFDFDALPRRFAAGFASPASAGLAIRLSARGRERASERPAEARRRLAPGPASRWGDLWLPLRDLAGAPGTIAVEVSSEAPATAWVGGVGPSPGRVAEARARRRELRARRRELTEVVLRYADETALVYENRDVLGPAWIAGGIERVPTAEEAWRRLATADGPVAIAVGDAGGLPSARATSDGTARVLPADDATVTVAVTAPSGGVLVLPRLPAPGWRASVDGRDTPVVAVDGALTGVVLPAGAREVRLRYAPASLWLGGAVSAIGLALAAALGARGARRDRDRSRPDE
jgi:hypothetical protein